MSSNNNNQDIEKPIVEENPEEIQEEEEGVDVELQNRLKNVNIDESAFTQNNKEEKAKEKKQKKKKGEDYFEYANKNGIQFDFKFEEKNERKKNYDNYADKYDRNDKNEKYGKNYNNRNDKNENSNYPQKTGYNGQKSGGKFYQNDGNSNSNSDSYNNKYSNYNNPRKFAKMGNNKFDLCNMHIPKMMVYDPFVMQECMYGNPMAMSMGYAPQTGYPPKQTQNFSDDKEILTFVENFFTVENLNVDLFIRNRIDENGFIDIMEIANFNVLRENGVSPQKIVEILSTSENDIVEIHKSESGDKLKLNLRNKEWDSIKDGLLSKDQISINKRNTKRQEKFAMTGNNMYQSHMPMQGVNQMMPQPNMHPMSMNMMNPMAMNYVNMQNNYFFAPQNTSQYGYPNYQYPGYQMQTPIPPQNQQNKAELEENK
jgi:hypothetical protein